jgi:hypothetical protein
MNRLVSVIVPNWNTRDDLLVFLESVHRQSYPRDAIEVILVDNGSADGSATAASDWYRGKRGEPWKRFAIVKCAENYGIAAAYNLGYAASGREAFAVLRAEPDIRLRPDVLSVLVADLLAEPRLGVVGARGVFQGRENVIDHAARYMNWWTGTLVDRDPSALAECDCVFGATLLVRRSAIEAMGEFFPEGRFLASELELCLRARRHGYTAACDPAAVAVHRAGASTNQLNREWLEFVDQKETALLHLRYNPLPSRLVWLAVAALANLRRYARGRRAALRGFAAGLRESFGASAAAGAPHRSCTVEEW